MLKKSPLIVFLLLSLFGVLIPLRLSNPICPQDDVGTIKQSRFSVVANIGIEEAKSEGEGPYQFSSILSADCDAEGNIYVLDYKSGENPQILRIRWIGPSKGSLKSISSKTIA
jgi:hypothetical protein